jgi:hypothetical protein
MKRIVSLALACALVLVAALAFAGSYLDRSALLLTQAQETNDFVLAHLGDKELAAVAQVTSEARVKAARDMAVPKDVAGVHPHLLLVMENSERAAAAAADGDNEKFLHHLRQARDEDATFRALLKQQHFSLPTLK